MGYSAFLLAAVFFAAVVLFAAAVFSAPAFFLVDFFVAAFFGFSSPSAAGASPSAAGFLCQPPRFSSGVKLAHFSLMQKGFLAPGPPF